MYTPVRLHLKPVAEQVDQHVHKPCRAQHGMVFRIHCQLRERPKTFLRIIPACVD